MQSRRFASGSMGRNINQFCRYRNMTKHSLMERHVMMVNPPVLTGSYSTPANSSRSSYGMRAVPVNMMRAPATMPLPSAMATVTVMPKS